MQQRRPFFVSLSLVSLCQGVKVTSWGRKGGDEYYRVYYLILSYPVLLVPGVGSVQELQRHVVVLVEPLHDDSLNPGGILGDLALVGRHVSHVGRVEPFYPTICTMGLVLVLWNLL